MWRVNAICAVVTGTLAAALIYTGGSGFAIGLNVFSCIVNIGAVWIATQLDKDTNDA